MLLGWDGTCILVPPPRPQAERRHRDEHQITPQSGDEGDDRNSNRGDRDCPIGPRGSALPAGGQQSCPPFSWSAGSPPSGGGFGEADAVELLVAAYGGFERGPQTRDPAFDRHLADAASHLAARRRAVPRLGAPVRAAATPTPARTPPPTNSDSPPRNHLTHPALPRQRVPYAPPGRYTTGAHSSRPLSH